MYRESELVSAIRDYLEGIRGEINGKGICACLSGGADSVALLCSLHELAREFGFVLYACHFNHGIRGAEADRDEEFCKKLCADIGVKIFCGRDDVPAYAAMYHKSVEEAARECRYAFFTRVLSKPDVDFCATAHNMNDDAETLLMNLCRGSGSNGASSISPRNGSILRPMLKVSRSEVEAYLASAEREYITDSTNLCNDYTRNYIRHEVIPVIEKVYPNAVAALSAFADSAREDRAYFESIIDNLDENLSVLPNPLLNRAILRKYKDFTGKIASKQILNSVADAVRAGGYRVIGIDGETEAIADNGKVLFFRRADDLGAQQALYTCSNVQIACRVLLFFCFGSADRAAACPGQSAQRRGHSPAERTLGNGLKTHVSSPPGSGTSSSGASAAGISVHAPASAPTAR